MRKQPIVFIIFVGAVLVSAVLIASVFFKTEPLGNQPRSPGGTVPVEKQP